MIASGWVAQGPRVAEFERSFAAHMETSEAVAVSSAARPPCTSRSSVAGIGPGDDVVVPSFSFIATANAVVYVGARPVFADVDPETGNLTADTVAEVLTPRTRAVIAVDQGGVPVDLDALRALCDPRGVVVIEDAACGAGSTYRGRPVGAGAEITAWSFHPRKVLTTGEGGMLTTRRGRLGAAGPAAARARHDVSAADRHANVLAPAEEYSEVGFNFRMTDLQAAVGLVQLGRLPEVVARRRSLAAGYTKAMDDIDGLRAVRDPAWGTTNFQSLLGGGAARRTRSTGTDCSAAWPGPRSRRAAASWPRTGSPRTPAGTPVARRSR